MSLKVVALFKVFEEFYNSGAIKSASEVTDILVNNFDYPHDTAENLSRIIVGSKRTESWKGYPLVVS